jgi:hypothetical protein
MTIEINETIARKLLSVVDAGLVQGVGEPTPGRMCVEAAVCYALDLPHGDDPQCVSRALRALKISLNDKEWSSPAARAAGLRRLAVAQLGSKGGLDDTEFARRVAESTIRKQVPGALRASANIQKNIECRAELIDAANRCEKEGTRDAAYYAAYAAADAAAASYAANAAAASYAANAAYYAAYAAADAAAAAASYAAAAAANAAAAASYAANAAYYASYANAAVNAAANAAANAASCANANAERRDEILSGFAEDVVQILISMDAPGCQWLPLTESTEYEPATSA